MNCPNASLANEIIIGGAVLSLQEELMLRLPPFARDKREGRRVLDTLLRVRDSRAGGNPSSFPDWLSLFVPACNHIFPSRKHVLTSSF